MAVNRVGYAQVGVRFIIDVVPNGIDGEPRGYTAIVGSHPLPSEDERAACHRQDNFVLSVNAPDLPTALSAAGGALASGDRVVQVVGASG